MPSNFYHFLSIFVVQVEIVKSQNPLEFTTALAEESLTFTNPLEDIEDYEEDEVTLPSPVLDPDLEAKVIYHSKLQNRFLNYFEFLNFRFAELASASARTFTFVPTSLLWPFSDYRNTCVRPCLPPLKADSKSNLFNGNWERLIKMQTSRFSKFLRVFYFLTELVEFSREIFETI